MANVRKRGLMVGDHDAFLEDSNLGFCTAALTASAAYAGTTAIVPISTFEGAAGIVG
jgi:hypothetical protein